MFLPSPLDRKEDIQKYNDHVHLHPVDNSYDQLKSINNNKILIHLIWIIAF